MQSDDLEYVGFWARVGAALIDSALIFIIIAPLITLYYGASYWTSGQTVHGVIDILLSWIFPAVAIIAFWIAKQATPGKMAISARIVDARSGDAPSRWQYVGRYLGYFVSTIPFFLGLLWVAFDRRKQGWHDKLAGTVVVRNRNGEPVTFDN